MNKKGAEMTIGTLIAIVLGILVLVLLIYGFSTGWGNLLSKITNFGPSNLQTVISACNLACSSNSVYDYCNLQREIKDDKFIKGTKLSCANLEVEALGLSCDIECPSS